MSSGHIVAVNIRPYLKDYLINRFGKEPIKATMRNKLFPFLVKFLTPIPKRWRPPVKEEGTLLIELPFNDAVNIRHLNYINPRHYVKINTYLYGLFYYHFIEYMNEKVIEKRWQIKYAIVNFIDVNNMNWDCTNYETLKRIYYRYRFPLADKLGENGKINTPAFNAKSKDMQSGFSKAY